MKKTSRLLIVILLIVLGVICSVCSAFGAIEKRRPYNNYYSSQNPPDFSWVHTNGATYSLVVATDKNLNNIVYRADNLTKNLYNFSEAFEPGQYYWSYSVNGGSYAEVYRFYIPRNASEYVIPFNYDNAEQMEAVIRAKLPKAHPRMLFSEDDFENIKHDFEGILNLRGTVDSGIEAGVPVQPRIFETEDELNSLTTAERSNYFGDYLAESEKASKTALLYNVTGEEKYKNFALGVVDAFLLRYQDNDTYENGRLLWDPSVLFPWNSYSDMYEAKFAYDIALCYDWMYNYLSEEQREGLIELIEDCLKRPYENFAKNGQINGSLYTQFVGSHPYRLNECTAAALCIYEDSGLARNLANFHFPILINITSPFSYQDGFGSQGMFYGIQNSLDEVIDVINNLGIVDIREKALLKNTAYRHIYTLSPDQTMVFGDCYNSPAKETYQYRTQIQNLAANGENDIMRSVNKWLLDKSNNGKSLYYNSFYNTYLDGYKVKNTEAVEPYMLPTSKVFTDTGIAAFNSSLIDDNKVALRFRSSPYGSYNHSHPDQNSFVIYGYGEYLAIDSDYYYSFGNDFDLLYNKQSWTHNTITYNGGVGQPHSNSGASGKITDFLYSPDVDMVKGDALNAYNFGSGGNSSANLSKFNRTIIYLKPDVFVVVDDLASANGSKSFEFWLNTKGTIDTDENDSSKATIAGENAYLFADVLYPEVTNQKYSFSQKPDGTFIDTSVITANRLTGNEPDNRIAFKTGNVASAKMVTMLSVNDENALPVEYSKETLDGYIKITAGDNTIYINNGNKTVINADDVSFIGEGAVVSSDSVMLINGTSLTYNGINYISSYTNISATVANGRISISNMNADANVTVYTGAVEEIYKTEDEKEVKLEKNVNEYGVKYTTNGNYTTFELYPSTYTFNINDSLHEGYIKINLEAGNGGTVSYDGSLRILKGASKKFIFEPDAGYYVKSVQLNGENISEANPLEYTTPPLTENAALNVEFAKTTSNLAPAAETYPKTFSYYHFGIGGNSNIVFGKINSMGYNIKECGIIYSYINKDFTLEDVDGKTVRKLEFDKELTHAGYFGVEVADASADKPSNLYARAYAVYEPFDNAEENNPKQSAFSLMSEEKMTLNEFMNSIDYSGAPVLEIIIADGTVYGEIISFEGDQAKNYAYIEELSYDNGYIYPAFSKDVLKYTVGTTDGSFDSFSYKLPAGTTAEITSADEYGESSFITVTDINGNKKTYEFIMMNASSENEEGVTYANGGTFIMASQPDNDFSEGGNKHGAALYNYQYQSYYSSNRYTLYRFGLTDINPFSDKITLSLGSSWSESNIENYADGYVLAAYDMDYTDESPDIYSLTYNNSIGNGSYIKDKKICVLNMDERITVYREDSARIGFVLQADITEFIKQKILEGKKEFVLMLTADESNNAWVKSSGGKLYNNVNLSQPDVTTLSIRPQILWE